MSLDETWGLRRCVEDAHGLTVEVPDGRRDLVVMGVEQVPPLVGVAGEVELPDAIRWDAREISARIEPVVPGRDEDVVHVEEDPASSETTGAVWPLVQAMSSAA
jgi:hypothetical protein